MQARFVPQNSYSIYVHTSPLSKVGPARLETDSLAMFDEYVEKIKMALEKNAPVAIRYVNLPNLTAFKIFKKYLGIFFGEGTILEDDAMTISGNWPRHFASHIGIARLDKSNIEMMWLLVDGRAEESESIQKLCQLLEEHFRFEYICAMANRGSNDNSQTTQNDKQASDASGSLRKYPRSRKAQVISAGPDTTSTNAPRLVDEHLP